MAWIELIGFMALVVNLLYWVWTLRTVLRVPVSSEAIQSGHRLEIIVVAHNALSDLKANLRHWLHQSYRNYNVLIADDGSQDGTDRWLEALSSPRIEFELFNKTEPGKKRSLARALDRTQADFVVLTDADCQPSSGDWLAKVYGQMSATQSEIFLGYSPVLKESGFLNKMVRFETLLTGVQFLSWAVAGRPYMGVGRNLAYTRRVSRHFTESMDHSIVSGDDDLFVQDVAGKYGVSFSLDPDTFVLTRGPGSWREWLNQKSRHVSSSFKYQMIVQVGLGSFAVSQILWPFVLSGGNAILIVLGRWLILYILMVPVMKRMNEQDLLRWLPILDVAIIIYYLLVLPLTMIRNKKKW